MSDWKNIIAIAAGNFHTVGLRSDGTVVSTKPAALLDFGQWKVSEWRNVVAITAYELLTVGLRADGTVVSTQITVKKWDGGQWKVSNWNDTLVPDADKSKTEAAPAVPLTDDLNALTEPTAEMIAGAAEGKLIKSGVRMRQGPSTNAPIIAMGLKSGTKLTVYAVDGDYYFVQVNETKQYGYISRQFVKLLSVLGETSTGNDQPEGTVRGTVTAANLALREGPSVTSKHIEQYYQGKLVYIYYQEGEYYYVMVAGTPLKGYMSAQYIHAEGTVPSKEAASSGFTPLKVGGTNDGETVKQVQQRLVDLYYLPYPEKDAEGKGVVTTVYGSMCAKAVAKFQERNGIQQTGQCDKATYDKLMSDKATAYTMKEKDQLDIVKSIQEALIKKGYLKGKATGYCGTDTVAAIKAFQKANNLTVDGHAGTKTLQLLLGY